MKEKLKKIFLNKNFWAVFFEIICAALIFVCGYFSGFASGLTIDDSIRTDLIDKSVEDAKNNKIDINKKTLKSEQYELIAIPYGSNSTDNIVFDVSYVLSKCEIYYQNIVNSSVLTGTKRAFLCSDLSFYNNLVYGKIFFFERNLNSFWDFKVYLINGNTYSIIDNSITIDNAFYAPILFTISSSGITNISRDYFGSYFIDSYFNSFNSYNFGTYNLQLFDLFDIGAFLLPNTTDAYNIGYNAGYKDFANSNEYRLALQTAYENGINAGYQSGVIEAVSEFKNSQEYRDALENEYINGYQNGVQAGIDGSNNADSVFDRVFMVIRNAGASFLNLFDFYIFPNMPFYVVIAIPFIIGSLFILFKILIK